MEVSEAIRIRRSTRSYDSTPVPNDVLHRILESGRIAPSTSNLQPWHFIVVTDEDKRRVLSRGRWAGFLTESPVVIVGCADTRRSRKWPIVDVSIAMQQMVLAATAEGLGTCWIGSFSEKSVKSLLKVPEHSRVVAMLAIGYPRDRETALKPPATRKRKTLGRITSWEEYGKQYQHLPESQ